MKNKFHLAQINIALAKAAMDDPLMSGFVARLEDINKLADGSPGFVWRLQTEYGDATALQPYNDDRIIVNMSVWETPEQLKDYVYRSVHSKVMRQRKKWFEKFDKMYYAMWWIPAGHIPTIEEAKERLEYLQKHGESKYSFSFSKLYPSPGENPEDPIIGFADPCPAV